MVIEFNMVLMALLVQWCCVTSGTGENAVEIMVVAILGVCDHLAMDGDNTCLVISWDTLLLCVDFNLN